MDIIYGKKTILFPFAPQDLSHFVALHRNDKEGYLQQYSLKNMTEEEATRFVIMLFNTKQISCWSVYAKSKINDKRLGFIYISELTSFSCQVSGVMDTSIMKGLLKYIRKGKVTFAEDALKTLVGYLFRIGLKRIETNALSTNRRALFLNKRVGFIQEGKLREAFNRGDKYIDVILFSILKKEWEDVKG